MHFLKLLLSFVGDLQQFSYEVRETTLIVFHKNMELQLISHRLPYHTTDFNYSMEILIRCSYVSLERKLIIFTCTCASQGVLIHRKIYL